MTHYLSCITSQVNDKQMYARFALGYFIPGQTLTVANTLRRGLLSQVPGISMSCVYIHKANHEYQSLFGVKECVLDILLRLKHIVIKGPEKITPTVAFFNVRGPGTVRAKHLQLPYFLQCANPEEIIATLNEKGQLQIKCLIVSGTGYLNLNNQPKLFKKHQRLLQNGNQKIKCFPVDGVFSPVVKVNYTIETTANHSEMTLMEIWTNGSLSPRDAIHKASRAIIQLFLPWQKQNESPDSQPLEKITKLDQPQKKFDPWDFSDTRDKLEQLYDQQEAAYELSLTSPNTDPFNPDRHFTLDPAFDQLPIPNQRRSQMRKLFYLQSWAQNLVTSQVPIVENEGGIPYMTPFKTSVFLGEQLNLRYNFLYQADIKVVAENPVHVLDWNQSKFDTSSIMNDYSQIRPEKLEKSFRMDISHVSLHPSIYTQLKRWNVKTVEQLRWLQPRDLFQMSFTLDQIEVIRKQVIMYVYKGK